MYEHNMVTQYAAFQFHCSLIFLFKNVSKVIYKRLVRSTNNIGDGGGGCSLVQIWISRSRVSRFELCHMIDRVCSYLRAQLQLPIMLLPRPPFPVGSYRVALCCTADERNSKCRIDHRRRDVSVRTGYFWLRIFEMKRRLRVNVATRFNDLSTTRSTLYAREYTVLRG